jgi:hypothetical protein
MKSAISSVFSQAAIFFRTSIHLWTGAAAITLGGAILGTGACSTSPAAAKCDDTKCQTDNKCIAEGAETKCRLTCDNDSTYGTKPCPTGYYCKQGAQNYCAADVDGTKRESWGKLCNPTEGDEACGAGFSCYARFTGDGQAFCTKRDCKADTDCLSPVFQCATLNKPAPDPKTPRDPGATVNICLPRSNCAPCKVDTDCPKDGTSPQACVSDGAGNYCMRTCESDTGCLTASSCQDKGGQKVCFPISGSCKGDGQLCAPCTIDNDCASKLCVRDPNNLTEERFCAGVAETAKCVYLPCLMANGGADCESGKCIQTSATEGVCAAAPTKDRAADAGVTPDGSVLPLESCRGTNVPKDAYRFCTEGTASAYCISLKELPDQGGLYRACYSRVPKP